jgi:hypothetical protein
LFTHIEPRVNRRNERHSKIMSDRCAYRPGGVPSKIPPSRASPGGLHHLGQHPRTSPARHLAEPATPASHVRSGRPASMHAGWTGDVLVISPRPPAEFSAIAKRRQRRRASLPRHRRLLAEHIGIAHAVQHVVRVQSSRSSGFQCGPAAGELPQGEGLKRLSRTGERSMPQDLRLDRLGTRSRGKASANAVPYRYCRAMPLIRFAGSCGFFNQNVAEI